jgi:hypothetical protein
MSSMEQQPPETVPEVPPMPDAPSGMPDETPPGTEA